ncbi:MAG: branched-chain amino acid ABC transporter permease [Chloroflexota bacterium]
MMNRHTISILLLTIVVLFLGWVESNTAEGVSQLTGGIITFSTLVRIGLFTIIVVGLNLLMGFAGQASLGQASFYGIGAYVSAIFTTRGVALGLPEGLVAQWWWPWLLMVAGVVITGIFVYFVGQPILRLKGHYLAMATLGLGIMIIILFRENFGIQPNTLNITGGFDGLPDVPRLRIGNFSLWPIERYYYLVWFFAILSIIIVQNIVNSRVGRALRAIHGSEIAAQAMGVDTAAFKLRVFMLSTMLASLAGSLFAHFQAAVSPRPFNFLASLELLVMAAVGGASTVWGALVGVSVILGIEELLRSRLHLVLESAGSEVEPVVFGVILVAIMIFLPNGLAKAGQQLFTRKNETDMEAAA